jgi:hypothetical protein
MAAGRDSPAAPSGATVPRAAMAPGGESPAAPSVAPVPRVRRPPQGAPLLLLARRLLAALVSTDGEPRATPALQAAMAAGRDSPAAPSAPVVPQA